MSLLKNYFDNTKQDSPILYHISAEMIQEVAEANLGRRLTDIEIERVHYSMLEDENAQFYLMDFMLRAAEDAMNETDNDWSIIDSEFEDRKHIYWLGKYSIGEDESSKDKTESFQEVLFKLLSKNYIKCLSRNVKHGLKAKRRVTKKQ